MYLPIPRLHLFEIDDQTWFPDPLRQHVQAVLAHFWTNQLPILQPSSPASIVARVLRAQLGSSALSEYTFVDFCAGAGGPTPAIERALNDGSRGRSGEKSGEGENNKTIDEDDHHHHQGVDFVLTDLHPHLPAWHAAAKQSPNILFVPAPIDASNVPPDLLSQAVRRRGQSIPPTNNPPNSPPFSLSLSRAPAPKKQFRIFSLALHHFTDADASRILRHALRTSSGFGIFELQSRSFESLGLMALLWPLLWAASWWWFWRQWGFLFWMYVVPVVPFVVVYDGVVSSLRTRTPEEVLALIRGTGGEGGSKKNANAEIKTEDDDADADTDGPIDWSKWHFQAGVESHTWPLGELNWFVAVKR